MAADAFELEVATPERLLIRERVPEAPIPAANGMIGILPYHAPLLSELGTGEWTYSSGGSRHAMIVSDGWVEVRNNHVRVLANRAELASEIDVTRAQAALKRANERLAHPTADLDVARAINAMRRAQARLAAANAANR